MIEQPIEEKNNQTFFHEEVFEKLGKCRGEIREITVLGVTTLEFNHEMEIKYLNISHINSTLLDLYI